MVARGFQHPYHYFIFYYEKSDLVYKVNQINLSFLFYFVLFYFPLSILSSILSSSILSINKQKNFYMCDVSKDF